MTENFNITGMGCSACSSKIQEKLNNTEGVKRAEVNLLTASMIVDFDEKKVTCDNIINIVEKLGYGASLKKNDYGEDFSDNSKILKDRFIFSLLFLIPLMYISMGSMLGFWLPKILSGKENALNFAIVQLVLCLPVVIINKKFYKNGVSSLIKMSPNMDTLIAVGSGASFIYGVFAVFRILYGIKVSDFELVMSYHSNLYFETAAMIPTLITLGKYLEELSKGKTKDAINKIMNLSPKKAILFVGGEEKEVETDKIKVSDIVVIKPGMSIPCDGKVIFGTTSIDESMLTGESIPVEKNIGDNVNTATVNVSGYIRVIAEKVGENTTFSEIVKLIEEASAKKAPISKLADKVSGIFVPIVMGIALFTFIIWIILGADFETAFSFGICVLVISCPCALGLATPVAVMVGTGKGAENGILIKSGEALETSHQINTVVFDKTGTITEGEPKVTDVFGDEKLLEVALALEENSEHPISKAVVEYAKNRVKNKVATESFENIEGFGVKAQIEEKLCYAVSRKFAIKNKIDISKFDKEFEKLSDEGKTVVYIIKENIALGVIAVADTVKDSAKNAIEKLNRMKIDVVMLTGDNEIVAKTIAKKVGIKKFIAGVLPQDKEKEIQKLIDNGKIVAMVGDGINDAPALARANVGIAMGQGTDVAIESADVVIMRKDLVSVPNSIKLSKYVMRNIKQNLFWAFFYNIIGIPIAAGVFYNSLDLKLSPMIGAFAMSISSLFVVTNALRIKNIRL